MSTSRKLWLGFGSLISLLIVTALVIRGFLASAERTLEDATVLHEPASAASYQMEIAASGIGMSVFEYLETGRDEYRERLQTYRKNFEQSKDRYKELSAGSEARRAVERVEDIFSRYISLGTELASRREKEKALRVELRTGFHQLLERSRNIWAGVDRSAQDAPAKLRLSIDLRSGIDSILEWLRSHRGAAAVPSPEFFVERSREIATLLAEFRGLPLTSDLERQLDEFEGGRNGLVPRVEAWLAMHGRLGEGRETFRGFQEELNGAIDRIQAVAHRSLLAANESVGKAYGSVLTAVSTLLLAGLIIGVLTALSVGKAILRTEKTLLESESRFRGAFDNASVGMILCDLEGCFVRVNGRFCEIVGHDEDELIGTPLQDITHPEDRAACLEHSRRLLEGKMSSYMMALRYIRGDGSTVWTDLTVSILRDERNQARHFIGLVEDTSRRNEVEQAFRESEARFRNLANAVPAIVWSADASGDCDFVNRRWTDYTGEPPETASESDGWDNLVHPDDRERLRAAEEAFRKGEVYEVEYRLRGKDGGYRWFLDRGVPVRDEREGTATRWFGTCTDIEDQKRLEQSLREADERKTDFLAVLGHEIRNPLAAIDSAVKLLEHSRKEEHFEWATKVMGDQMRQLVSLLNDLLDITRISRGVISLRRQQMEIAPIVERAVAAVKPFMEEQRHEFSVNCPEGLAAHVDPTRIEQILVNLLMNAAKYTPTGGHVELRARRDGEAVDIRIRDDGMGIPASVQERIFDPFWQMRTSGQPGLGIGLSLVKKLTELHGGTISVTSDGSGSGTEFSVRLPLADDRDTVPAPPDHERARPPASAAASAPVLVVDDNVDAAQAISLLLESFGWRVKTVFDGRSAIASAGDEPPAAILLDIGLPDISGYEVARKLRANERLRDTLLIALSGFGHDEARKAAREAGFDHHLAKPADVETLRELLAAGKPEALQDHRGH